MKNLEQIRAANALTAASNIRSGREGGKVVKDIPHYIRNNGLLGAAAFAKETGKGYKDVFEEGIIKHLKDEEINLLNTSSLDDFISKLGKSDSAKLRIVTNEAMAYLNYLRRFAD